MEFLRRLLYVASFAACRCSQRCTRVSSHTATLNLIHGERSRCGRKDRARRKHDAIAPRGFREGQRILNMGKRAQTEHAVARLREQFQSDLLEGAYNIEPRLASDVQWRRHKRRHGMSRIGIAISGGPNPAEIIDLVILAESLGYASAWVAEGHGGDHEPR